VFSFSKDSFKKYLDRSLEGIRWDYY